MQKFHSLKSLAFLSFCFCVTAGLFLSLGVCDSNNDTTSANDYFLHFVSDKLQECSNSEYLLARILPWVFVLAVLSQILTLWCVWIMFVHCDLHLKLTFHYLSFHTVFSLACVAEFLNVGTRESKFDWLGWGHVSENFLHVFFAVNAIVDYFLLHLCVVYAYYTRLKDDVNDVAWSAYMCDLAVYFVLAIFFFLLWLGNINATAAVLEWTILIVGLSLNFWAVILCPDNFAARVHDRTHSSIFWVSILLALIGSSVIGVLISAPPKFFVTHSARFLTTSVQFNIVVVALTAVIVYEFLSYLNM